MLALYIRTDMNENIATGHMMRCMSIADAARELGFDAKFITSDHKGDKLLKANGFENMVLDIDYLELIQGIDIILDTVSKEGILLIDTYSPTEEFMRAMRGKVYTAYIDDMGEQIFNVDCIICYAPYHYSFEYEKRYDKRITKILLGPNYAPLRKDFRNCKQKIIKEKIENILIVSGGSDPYRITPQILETLEKKTPAHIKAVCGMYSGYVDELRERYSESGSKVEIVSATPKIKKLFDEADVVITAAGSTMYELCATGTPAIAYTYAENQWPNANEFDKLGVIPYIGDVTEIDILLQNCIAELNKIYHKDVRKKYLKRCNH